VMPVSTDTIEKVTEKLDNSLHDRV
jgi:hypothetical protein